MPAPAQYEAPHRQLRRLAVQARADGLTFEEFWEQAMRPGRSYITRARLRPPENCVIWPRDTFDRQNCLAAILATREVWRACYEGAPPSRAELAVQTLGPALAPEPERVLALC